MDIKNETFYKLLDNAKVGEDSSLDNLFVVLKYDCYLIECYKWYEDLASDFNIDECGYEVFGKWKNLTLTDYQYSLLESKFNKMRDEWVEEYEKEQQKELDEQNEEPNGGIDDFHFWNNIYN